MHISSQLRNLLRRVIGIWLRRVIGAWLRRVIGTWLRRVIGIWLRRVIGTWLRRVLVSGIDLDQYVRDTRRKKKNCKTYTRSMTIREFIRQEFQHVAQVCDTQSFSHATSPRVSRISAHCNSLISRGSNGWQVLQPMREAYSQWNIRQSWARKG